MSSALSIPSITAATPEAARFVRLMQAVAVIAALAHAVFSALFMALGLTEMGCINVASVLTYGLAYMLIRSRHMMVAQALMCLEIVLHGLLAVRLLGWDSGFHFYVVLIIPVALVSSTVSMTVKVSVAVATALCYLAMDMAFRHAQPPHQLAPLVLDALHYFNLASALTILSLLSLLYGHLVRQAEVKLKVLACTDPLTHLHNRRFAMEVAQHEAAVFQRGGRPLSVLIGDIDHFKQVNDQYGHAQGDQALKAVARVLRAGVREVDHVARWGGEEFLMLLPGTDGEEAVQVAERLRQGVGDLASAGGPPFPLSITLGLTVLAPGESVEQALARADRALYQGKQAGRNRVVVAAQA